MSTIAHTRAELATKSDAFDLELASWSLATKDLPAHTSQIKRLVAVLGPVSKSVRAGIAAKNDAALALSSHRATSEVLLLFRIWAFYRDKLAQRYVPWHKPYLTVADDLAYRWWRPALDAALARSPGIADRARLTKAPPLVYFNGDISPLTLTRGGTFAAEAAQGLLPEHVAWAEDLLRASPVPVIGVPYFTGRHFPDLLVIAHEVGHNVEADFGLTGELHAAVEAGLREVPPLRRRAWDAWIGEIFADLWGVLCAGPAFVDALLALAMTDPTRVESETRPQADGWGDYPTLMLRAELLFAALAQLGLADAGASRRQAFRARFPANAMAAYEPDGAAVVTALLDCVPEVFGVPIRSLHKDAAARHGKAVALAGELAKNRKNVERDTLVLVQALACAFDADPAVVAAPERSEALFAALLATVEATVRGAPAATVSPADLAAEDARRAAALSAALRAP